MRQRRRGGIAYNVSMQTAYPAYLEAWWIQRARQVTGAGSNDEALRRLEADAKRLSDAFTTERRDGFGGYAEDERALVAYGCFYYPQTWVRIRFALEELAARGWSPPRQVRLLDVGTGTGAALVSAATWLANKGHAVDATGLDISSASLEWAKQLTAGLGSRARGPVDVHYHLTDLGMPESWSGTTYDLVIASFTLNETRFEVARFLAWVERVMERVTPEGILLLQEPAIAAVAETFERARDAIAARHRYHLWVPCLHAAPCPLLAKGDFFCHEVRRWWPPTSLLDLNRRLQRTVETVKYVFLAMSRIPPTPLQGGLAAFRLVAPVNARKGRWLLTGCAADGCKHRYEIQRRDASPEEIHLLETLERGDIVGARAARLLGDGTLRLSGLSLVHGMLR